MTVQESGPCALQLPPILFVFELAAASPGLGRRRPWRTLCVLYAVMFGCSSSADTLVQAATSAPVAAAISFALLTAWRREGLHGCYALPQLLPQAELAGWLALLALLYATLGVGLGAECVPPVLGGLQTLLACYTGLLLLLCTLAIHAPDRLDGSRASSPERTGAAAGHGGEEEEGQGQGEGEGEPEWRTLALCALLSAAISVACVFLPPLKIVAGALVLLPQYGLSPCGLLWTLLLVGRALQLQLAACAGGRASAPLLLSLNEPATQPHRDVKLQRGVALRLLSVVALIVAVGGGACLLAGPQFDRRPGRSREQHVDSGGGEEPWLQLGALGLGAAMLVFAFCCGCGWGCRRFVCKPTAPEPKTS